MKGQMDYFFLARLPILDRGLLFCQYHVSEHDGRVVYCGMLLSVRKDSELRTLSKT